MIHPRIRVEDVDGCGFDRLVLVLRKRDTTGAPEVHLLHESGRVLGVVHTRTGPIEGPHDDVTDAAETAARLRVQHGVARAVVADADALTMLAAMEPDLVGVDTMQPTLLTRLTAAFWSSPGVVADPPVAPSRMPDLAARLRALPDGLLTLVVRDKGETVIALAARLRAGLLTTIEPLRADEPVVLALDLAWPEFEAIFGSTDVAAALLERVGA